MSLPSGNEAVDTRDSHASDEDFPDGRVSDRVFDFCRSPHRFLLDLALDQSPIARFRINDEPFAVVSSPEFVHAVMAGSLEDFEKGPLYMGQVWTENARVKESIDIIRAEWKRMASGEVTAEEVDSAKTYITGSYALRFDSNSKIASQLLGLFEEGFGPDYVDKRNDIIAAITLDDAKRVAKRLLENDDLIVTIVGKPAPDAAAERKG